MGAAENEGVGALLEYRLDPGPDRLFHCGPIDDSGFHYLNPIGAGGCPDRGISAESLDDGLVELTLKGRGGGQHGDHPSAGLYGRRLHGRFHSDENGIGELRPKIVKGGRRRRIAGDDDCLRSSLDQTTRDVLGDVGDFFQ